MKQRELRKLYTQDVVTDPDTGREKRVLRYTGPHYVLDTDQVRCLLPRLWGGWLLCAAAFVGAGLTPARGTYCVYVLPQYVFLLLPLLYGIMSCTKISRIRTDRINEVQKQEGVESLKHSALGLLILSVAWFLGEGVFMLLNPLTNWQADAIFLSCSLLSALGGLLLSFTAKKITVQPDA